MEIDFVRSRFIKHFDGKTGNIYASPGRINLIGEHTDYNGGFVFPGAVEQGIMVEIRPNGHVSLQVRRSKRSRYHMGTLYFWHLQGNDGTGY